jgi:hypothetical protein
MKDIWCKKEFLTPENEPSTSTVVSFAGKIKWSSKQDSEEDLYFVEVSSCHERARLHRTYEMSMAEWVDQVTKLRDHLNKYLVFLSEDRV